MRYLEDYDDAAETALERLKRTAFPDRDRSKSGQGYEPADFAFENDEYDSELNVMVQKVILMCGEIKERFTSKKRTSKAKRKGAKR